MISETKTKTKTKPKLPLSVTEELYKEYNNSLDFLSSIGKEIGFEVERNKDYGAGTIDVIWNMTVHPALPVMKCGFIKLKAEERGSKDTEDNQFSIRKNLTQFQNHLKSHLKNHLINYFNQNNFHYSFRSLQKIRNENFKEKKIILLRVKIMMSS